MTGAPADHHDYVVVGGGTAGCVLAARLTEDPRTSVLLIEAGGDERRPDVESPEQWPALLGSDADWGFETVRQPGTGRTCLAARGRVLGGSGSINNMVHLRGHAADFDGWAEDGAHGWEHARVLPYFRRSEDVPDGDPRYRGRGGPLHPRPSGTSDPVGLRFAEGARRAGHEQVADLNGAAMLGVGFPDALIVRDRRESTASAYLRPAMDRPNLTVRQHAAVRRLRIDGGRCTGVEYHRDGTRQLATAASEVVLCAGAVGSPHLLLLSGVGPADELSALGIEPAVHAPEVGHNLQDHPLLAGIRYRAERPLPPEYLRPAATLLARSDPDSAAPDLHVTAAGMDFHYEWQEPFPNSITFAVGLMRTRSRGTVRLGSADPDRPPLSQRPRRRRRPGRRDRAGRGDRRDRGVRRMGRPLGEHRAAPAGARRARTRRPGRDGQLLPPRRHLPDGLGHRRRGGPAAAGGGRARIARRGCLGDADAGVLQPERGDGDDRGEGSRSAAWTGDGWGR